MSLLTEQRAWQWGGGDCHCWERSGQKPGQGADGGHWEAAGTLACLMERWVNAGKAGYQVRTR